MARGCASRVGVAEHEGALTRTCTVHPGRGRGRALLDASDASIHHEMRKRVWGKAAVIACTARLC